MRISDWSSDVCSSDLVLAGYSLGDADLLRRAMGKKDQKEMDAQRQRFVEGCKRVSSIDARQAGELFDLIDKFAGYGRSEERRVGKEDVSTCRSRVYPYHSKQQIKINKTQKKER